MNPRYSGKFRKLLGRDDLAALPRCDFYEACCADSVRLAISTGEKRIYANVLLTIGVS